jgi:hypothetical protein
MRIRRHLTYANVMSTIAVIIAVAGGSTAVAVTVNASKKSDINKKGNIRAGRVTTPKLANSAVSSPKLAGIEVVQTTTPAGILAQARCPAGARLLSGGAAVGGSGSLASSRPGTGEVWEAVTTAGNVTAYSLCLR